MQVGRVILYRNLSRLRSPDPQSGKITVRGIKTMNEHKKHFAICVDNDDYEASLIFRKTYEIIPDAASRDDLIRIVDESGEDYLYHQSHFIVADFPIEVEHALLSAQGVTSAIINAR